MVLPKNKNDLTLFLFSNNGYQNLTGTYFTKSNNTRNINFQSYYNRAIGAGSYWSQNPYNGIVRVGGIYDNDGLDAFIANSAATENRYSINSSDNSLINRNERSVDKSQISKPQSPKLVLLNIDGENRILTAKVISDTMNKNEFAYINDAKILQTKRGFLAIFNLNANSNKKETFGFLKIDPVNFSYVYNPLILMNVNYKLSLAQSLQISDALIAPCISDYKIIFTKIVFD